MSNAEITKDIVIAMINNKCFDYIDKNYADSVASTFETIYKKVSEVNVHRLK